jgi:hypothetical protein
MGTAMDERQEIESYNYATFEASEEAVFPGFRTALPVGSAAPDVAVTIADTGQPAHLSDFWRGRDLVIEFGSLT